MATEQQLMTALAAADEAGNTEDAQRIADEIKTLRGGGQPTPATVPLGGEAGPAPEDTDDPFATVPTEINGYVLPPVLRQAFLDGRKIEDPHEKRLAAATLAGTIAARSEGGNAADKFARSQAGAGLFGIGAGLFGLGDIAGATGTALSGDMSFGEALAAQRAFRHALEEDHPLTSLTGEIGGAVLSGSTALKGAQALAAGSKAAPALAKATVFTKGGGVKGLIANIARGSGAGALSSGVTEGISEGQPVKGALIGTLAGPLGVGLAKAANITSGAIKRVADDPAAAGLRAMAKKIGVSSDEMARRFLQFRSVTGKAPTMAEIADDQAVAELRTLISERTSAAAILREGVEEIEGRRGAEFAQQVTGGRVVSTQGAQKATRDVIAREQFGAVEDELFEFSGRQVQDLLSDPDLRRVLPATLKGRIDEVLKDVAEDAPATLTGLDVNDLRLALRRAGKGATGADRVFNELADEVEEIARAQSEGFGRAIDEFAARSSRGRGVEAGRKVTTAKTSEFVGEAGRVTSPDVGAGMRVGARSALADTAREGASPAARLARSLKDDTGLVERLKAVFPAAEVDRLQELGTVQAKAARNLQTLAPGVRAETDATKQMVKDLVTGGVIASGGSIGGAAKAGVLSNQISKMVPKKISKKVADNLARDLLDPTKTEKAIDALRRAELGDAQILDLFASAMVAGEVGTFE